MGETKRAKHFPRLGGFDKRRASEQTLIIPWMSWHFLAVGEEASWEGSSLDGAPAALSRLMPTASGHFLPDSETAACIHSPSGMMLPPSTGNRGEVPSTSSRADSPAKTSAQPEKAKASPGPEADYGRNLPASFAKWDPDTSSWRTHQYSLLGGLELFSETWPRWGMMRDGESFQLPTPSGLLALRAWITSESESGSSLPTPTASMLTEADMEQAKYAGNSRNRPSYQDAKRMPTIRKSDGERGGRGDLIQAVRGNPNKHWTRLTTPTADDTGLRKNKYAQGGSALSHLVLQLELVREYRRLPTVVSVSESGGRCGLDGGSHARAKMTEQEIKELTGGSLNPEWTEWFQGWPIGWTDLEPLGTGRLRQWFDSHGTF